jgi:hypothetical protein
VGAVGEGREGGWFGDCEVGWGGISGFGDINNNID